MKLTLLQENLKNAVNQTFRFTSPKAQLPILGNILLKAGKSKLTLSATNLEISITTSVAAKVIEEGEITISGKTLNDVVSNLSSGSIEINVEKEQMKIISGTFKSTILGVNSNDFPSLPEKVGPISIVLKSNDFKNSLQKVLFAVSQDETRPILTGVLFAFKSGSLYLVATDGFRLSEVKLKGVFGTSGAWPNSSVEDMKIIIPKNVLHELIKIDEHNSEDIVLSYEKENNQVVFGVGETILSSRVIEGDFPDYEKIIPSQSIAMFSIDKNEFEKAIKLASVFARDSGNIVKLLILNNKLQIKAESSASGNQEMEIEIRPEEEIEQEVNIMFNFRFIDEVLKVVADDEVKIVIAPDNKASKFLDSKASNFLHIIMPIKTN